QVGLQALDLSGFGRVELPHSAAVDQRGSLTVEAWINVTSFPNTWMPIVYKGGGAGARTYSLWLNNSGYLWFGTNDASGSQSVQTAAGTINPDHWYHVAGVIDRARGQMRPY